VLHWYGIKRTLFEAFGLSGNVNSTVAKRDCIASIVIEVWEEYISGNC
jgi:hypothetical protein